MSDKMNKSLIGKAVKKNPALQEDDVRNYLMMNPDFFDLNVDLLTLLKPTRSKRAENIVDFQAILLERLQREVAALNDTQGTIIHASRSNMTTQARIHAAVLCLLEAEDYDHLCHIVCNDWSQILQVDSIIICFSDNGPVALPENNNIRLLKTDIITNFMGHETAAILRGNVEGAMEIYGPATPLVKAEALIRIEETAHNPLGILAFGSRDEDFFAPGQGTELLRFLAAAFQGQLKNHLPKAGS
ncbi:MAG: DUF484 family protein [Emcibacter sp.]|nr:DUF484 family protein [Emcibacter sp.]